MKLNAHTKTLAKRFFLLVGVFCFTFLKAQINLIPNPSFEDTISRPIGCGELNKAKDWYPIANRTPDYYSVFSPTIVGFPAATCIGTVTIPKNCMGFQYARTGNFYCGVFLRTSYTTPLYASYAELISVRLSQTLLANHSYSFTLYYSLADGSDLTTDQLSAYFSQNPFTSPMFAPADTSCYFNYLSTQINHDSSFITDTSNWIPLTGCFIAKGGEEYVTIGNFKDGVKSGIMNIPTSFIRCPGWNGPACYVYIDDVSLYDMGLYLPASCKNDTLICNGTNLALANNVKDSSVVVWTPSAALTCTTCPNPIASPTTTTIYYLNKSICGANSKDSILVQVHTPTTTANAGNDKTICVGDYIQIGNNDSLAFTNYSWQFNATLSCSNCAMPFAFPTISTTYTVQRTECTNVTTDTVKVIVDDCDPTFTIPNVFTPNYDNVNDTWGINFNTVNSHIKNYKMSIYDRWGLLIYESNPDVSLPKSKWDGHTNSGEECTNGVYYYIITFEKNENHILLKGHLNLFR